MFKGAIIWTCAMWITTHLLSGADFRIQNLGTAAETVTVDLASGPVTGLQIPVGVAVTVNADSVTHDAVDYEPVEPSSVCHLIIGDSGVGFVEVETQDAESLRACAQILSALLGVSLFACGFWPLRHFEP